LCTEAKRFFDERKWKTDGKKEEINMKRNIAHLIAALLTLSLVFLAGCGPAGTVSGEPGDGPGAGTGGGSKVLNIAVNRDITSLDGSGGGFTSTNASMQIYDCLVRLNDKLEVEPALATQWEMVDPLTWRFHLREGVTFHDGSAFNAQSVLFTINHYTQAIKYKYSTQWSTAWPPTCEIEDEYTVLIKTQTPQPATPRLLSRLPMLPDNYGGLTVEEFFSRPIGTGAYKFSQWDQGICLTLEANPDYWRCTPSIQTVRYHTVSDDNARMAGLQSGEYQVAFAVPYEQVEKVQGTKGLKVLSVPTIGYDAIQFNFHFREGSPISDIRIRQAMLYAIDHAGICKVIMSGYQEPAAGPSPMNIAGAYDGGGFPARDLDKAKQLMEQAGYQNEEIKFVFHSGEFTSDVEVSELVLSQLLEAGFNVTFTQVESGAWTDIKGTDQWDLTNNSVPGSFSGEAQYHYNQMKNLTGLYLEEFETILQQADMDTEQSEAERGEDISRAMKVLWDYVPYAFGTVPTSSIGMVENLDGFEYIPLNWLILAQASLGG